MQVLHVEAEMFPLLKTGGQADSVADCSLEQCII